MKSKSHAQYFTEAIVGVFMIAVILMLAYFTIVISGVDVIRGKEKCDIAIAFVHVGGLKDHDSVMYRGTKVGVVEFVEVTPSNLVVHANVDRNLTLREKCEITVRNLSMLGGNYLHLEEGEGEVIPLEGTLFKGETPTDWMQDLKAVAQNVRKLTEMSEVKNIVTNFEAVSVKINRFMEKADRIVARFDDEQFAADVKESVAGIKNTMSDARSTLGDAKSAIGDAKAALVEAKAGLAAFRKAAEAFDPKSLDMTETKGKANELLDNLNVIAGKLKNGEGTLGRLANEDGLYKELDGLMKDIRQVIDNYRDTTPISTFSSLATGAL